MKELFEEMNNDFETFTNQVEEFEVKLAERLKRRIERLAIQKLEAKLHQEKVLFLTLGDVEDEVINAIEELSVSVCNDNDFKEMCLNIKRKLEE